MINQGKKSKTVRILEILLERGAMRFRDIQRELWKMSHDPGTEPGRGYWCTNLTGGHFYHKGILNNFATKGQDGLWRPKYLVVPSKPWSLVRH